MMIKTMHLPCLALLALAAPQQGRAESAAPAQPRAGAATPDLDADRAAVGASDPARMLTDRTYATEMLVRLDRLAAVAVDDPDQRLAIDHVRLFALIGLERADEIRATVDRMLAARPRDPDPYSGAWMAALSIEDMGRALAVVETASRNVPGSGWAELRTLFERDHAFLVLRHFSAQGDEASRVRLAEALFRIGWPGPDAREGQDSIRLILLDHRLKQGNRAAAADLAATLTTPSNIAPLIVQRRYDPLFAGDDARLARFSEALAEHDRHTADAVAAAPNDYRTVLDRAQLLRSRGRDAEALALLNPFIRDVPATATAEEQGMWLVNEAVYALLALGRKDEAAALMRRLAALPVANHPYLVSASINYGEVLWEAGRFADSLAHARMLERDSLQFASDYGDMWVHATIVCALASLDRAAEAAPTLDRMRALGAANPAAMSRAYLCLNDLAAAEALMVQRLESEDQREGALMALQDYRLIPAGGVNPLMARLAGLRDRPAVRAAIERVGRVLPLPAARTYWGDS